jgi:hypothetical protein
MAQTEVQFGADRRPEVLRDSGSYLEHAGAEMPEMHERWAMAD